MEPVIECKSPTFTVSPLLPSDFSEPPHAVIDATMVIVIISAANLLIPFFITLPLFPVFHRCPIIIEKRSHHPLWIMTPLPCFVYFVFDVAFNLSQDFQKKHLEKPIFTLVFQTFPNFL